MWRRGVCGSVQAVGRPQHEAAKALNYTTYQMYRYVLIPQAIPVMIPSFGNLQIELLKLTAVVSLITMFKETPLLSAITVIELFNAANIYSNSNYKYLEPMTLVGLFFLIVSIPSAYIAARLEQKFTPKH